MWAHLSVSYSLINVTGKWLGIACLYALFTFWGINLNFCQVTTDRQLNWQHHRSNKPRQTDRWTQRHAYQPSMHRHSLGPKLGGLVVQQTPWLERCLTAVYSPPTLCHSHHLQCSDEYRFLYNGKYISVENNPLQGYVELHIETMIKVFLSLFMA